MVLISDHSYIDNDSTSNKLAIQVDRIKVKVTVAVFREKKLCHPSSAFIYGLILI